jgi:hypothetical protein
MKRVDTLKTGDKVDLDSCPFLHDEPAAEFEYAVVGEIRPEGPVLVVDYDNLGLCCAYHPEQLLEVADDSSTTDE